MMLTKVALSTPSTHFVYQGGRGLDPRVRRYHVTDGILLDGTGYLPYCVFRGIGLTAGRVS